MEISCLGGCISLYQAKFGVYGDELLRNLHSVYQALYTLYGDECFGRLCSLFQALVAARGWSRRAR